MNERVLFVDDDILILNTFKRILEDEINFTGVTSAEEALKVMKKSSPFAVVVSDFLMPGMNGLEFLSILKEDYPDTTRILLTGNADLNTALTAINEDHIYKFLTKPVSKEILLKAITSGLKQYRLITMEKVLLENTLTNSIEVLTDLISFVSPHIGDKSNRIERYVEHILEKLKLKDNWEFKIAGLLSQTGLLSVPYEIRKKISVFEQLNEKEQPLYENHPYIGRKLIEKIPRMENIAMMIEGQMKNYSSFCKEEIDNNISLGAQILKVVIDFDSMTSKDEDKSIVIDQMLKKPEEYNVEIVKMLSDVEFQLPDYIRKSLYVEELTYFMIFDQDVKASNNIILIKKGKVVNNAVLNLLNSFKTGIGVQEPIIMKVHKK